jgi:hypothetical protein
MKRQKGHLFAVVRVDHWVPASCPFEDRITVKEVLTTQESAEKEVTRLMKLQAGKNIEYFWKLTRLVADTR